MTSRREFLAGVAAATIPIPQSGDDVGEFVPTLTGWSGVEAPADAIALDAPELVMTIEEYVERFARPGVARMIETAESAIADCLEAYLQD